MISINKLWLCTCLADVDGNRSPYIIKEIQHIDFINLKQIGVCKLSLIKPITIF